MSKPDNRDEALLPNLGSRQAAISILVLTQAIALVITVSRNSALTEAALLDLLIVSAFAQLIAISGIIVLKLVAKPIQRMSSASGIIATFVLLLGITAGVTEGTVVALYQSGITTELRPDWHASLLFRNLIIGAVVIALALRYLVIHQRTHLEARSKDAATLQALQSRIRPHFLFNSMNSIASLLKSDPEKAENALQNLADVFRVLMADARKLVPITAERELARQYLDVEKIRLGDRLQVKWLASNIPRSAQIPSLTLQPLLENAIYHGIEPLLTGGLIKIELWIERDMLNIMITNPVPEVPTKALHKGNKIAMDNIRERLAQHFSNKATLQAFEQFGNYHVKIRMPLIKG